MFKTLRVFAAARYRSVLLGVAAVYVGAPAHAQTGQFVVSTVAGGGQFPPTPALSMGIGRPDGIATDPAGNIFFTSLSTVFRLDTNGVATQFAGTGIAGDSGDGGPAVRAQLNRPTALASDSRGNLYVADTGNGRIRKVAPDGTIATIAGNGKTCCYNDGAGDGGPATAAQLFWPYQLAADSSGSVYIGEWNTCRVRRISADGIITTVVGNGKCRYSGDGGPAVSAEIGAPWGLAFDASDNLYMTDAIPGDDIVPSATHIRKVSADGIITTVAGAGEVAYSGDGGPALSASFYEPGSLAVDRGGNVYVADHLRVRKISADGSVSAVAGNGEFGYAGDDGPATSAKLSSSLSGEGLSLAIDPVGNLYIADAGNYRVRRISLDGRITTAAGNGSSNCCYSGDGGPAASARLNHPAGVAIDSVGNLYVADTWNNRVRRISPSGIITTVAEPVGPDNTETGLAWPTGLTLDRSGNLLIADAANHRIRRLSPSGSITTVAGSGIGGFAGDGGDARSAQLFWPKDVALDADGNLYVADTANHAIRKISSAGIITTVAGTGVAGFSGDGGPATLARLNLPSGVAVDNRGNLYISDTSNLRVRRITPGGIITTVAEPRFFDYPPADRSPLDPLPMPFPLGIKADATGAVYFSDAAGIRRISPEGDLSIVGGNGKQGYSSDGEPAVNTQVNAWGIAFDPGGNLYVADPWSDIVRVLRPKP
jgi:sugar lactone lactonase YvrE